MGNKTAVQEGIPLDWIGSPPVVFQKLQDFLNDPNLSFADLELIISTDPSLTARLLKIANSSLYCPESKVETISHALGIIGIRQVIQLALATIMVQEFKGIPKDLFDMETFWRHSIACGLAAREIGRNLLLDKLDALYIAGMLHDLGSLIIYKKNPDKAIKTLTRCKHEGTSQTDVEDQVFGFSHAKAGGIIFQQWDLDPSLGEAVRFHHEPAKAQKYYLEAAILHTADIIAYKMKYGLKERDITPQIDSNAVRLVEVDITTLPAIRDAVESEIEEVFYLFDT